MTLDRQLLPSLYSQFDVAPGVRHRSITADDEQVELLRSILTAQDHTNELLEELTSTVAAHHKQRASELHNWRNAHPELAKSCRHAAEALTRVQIEFLDRLTEEVTDTREDLVDGDFLLNEFIDRYGPRLAHLNGLIHVLAQLSNVPTPAGAAR